MTSMLQGGNRRHCWLRSQKEHLAATLRRVCLPAYSLQLPAGALVLADPARRPMPTMYKAICAAEGGDETV